jgi:hypothetical protein
MGKIGESQSRNYRSSSHFHTSWLQMLWFTTMGIETNNKTTVAIVTVLGEFGPLIRAARGESFHSRINI